MNQLNLNSQAMSISEKFCLKWNDFQENIISTFESLREDTDFTDLTLACEDGHQVEAHMVILAASSPIFQNLLKMKKHAHPIIYMRGMNSLDLNAILDFLYHGEANIYQENLDSFLAIAEDLKLKGLTGEPQNPVKVESQNVNQNLESPKYCRQQSSKIVVTDDDKFLLHKTSTDEKPKQERALVIQSEVLSGRLQELDEKIKSMYTTTKKDGQCFWICELCGKDAKSNTNMKNHIESNHIEGISLPCNFCEKIFRSRNTLRMHKSSSHK